MIPCMASGGGLLSRFRNWLRPGEGPKPPSGNVMLWLLRGCFGVIVIGLAVVVFNRTETSIEFEYGSAALIAGVDEAWEVCLLKFTMDLIQRSSGENLDEWKRRGLM